MRVLVTGSRNWTNEALISEHLQRAGATEVWHGGARGADRLAQRAAYKLHIPTRVFEADWQRYGRSAGVIRNDEMIAAGPDLVIAFWDGRSNGTRHCFEAAHKAGLQVKVVLDPGKV